MPASRSGTPRSNAVPSTVPRDVLGTLNAAMLSEDEVSREQFRTAVYVELRPTAGGAHAEL